jgi:uncharacterized protein
MCLASIAMEKTLPMDIIDFGSAVPDISESRPPADRLLSGNPLTTARNFFSDAQHGFHVGTWQSSVGRWRVTYKEHEFCHITSGRVRIRTEQRQWEFGPGRSFVIPAGFEGIWEVLEPVSKLYVIFEPPQPSSDRIQPSTGPLADLCAPA